MAKIGSKVSQQITLLAQRADEENSNILPEVIRICAAHVPRTDGYWDAAKARLVLMTVARSSSRSGGGANLELAISTIDEQQAVEIARVLREKIAVWAPLAKASPPADVPTSP